MMSSIKSFKQSQNFAKDMGYMQLLLVLAIVVVVVVILVSSTTTYI
jgi:hypothetical protein